MSLILSNAGRLKPEIRLAQAVSQFEAELSSEEKSLFRNHRAQSVASPPDTNDVMRFTAEIDRRVSWKVGGRCLGPRFTNCLQSIQQFAALGDVIVGGSQNIIACGVWSLVRMSLLAVVNISAYLEKVSALFMSVGRSAPRYESLALLYPRSKRLQSYFCEYFIVIVSLCHHISKFAHKSTFAQVMSSLSDADANKYQADLTYWAEQITEEINLLLAMRIEEEAKENLRFRALAKRFSNSTSYHQNLAIKIRILDLCSKYDHVTTWKQIRKAGNASWFRQDAAYLNWRSRNPTSSTLAYRGKLGSGKSVLLANIVEDLHVSVQNQGNNTPVAYFFCRHDIDESLKHRTIIGSLARQLLQSSLDLGMAADVYRKANTALLSSQFIDLLRNALPLAYKAYIILDGFDECGRDDREALVAQLRDLQGLFELHLCISFREGPNTLLDLGSANLASSSISTIPEENPDIEAFIEADLKCHLESGQLTIGDPALILEIQDTLWKGSQGMFLWVALQIQCLCSEATDQAIRDALADLPIDLSETFSRILRKSPPAWKSYQMKLLQIISAAYRPLTTDELREALSVAPGVTVWEPSKLLNNVYSALTSCGCLLTVDEEESTVRFVHHSVKQYLLNEYRDATNIPFEMDTAQHMMVDIIVTYLNYDVMGTELSTEVPELRASSMPAKVLHSALGNSRSAQKVAVKLLKARRQSTFSISRSLIEAQMDLEPISVAKFHFQHYAKSHWLQHIQYFSQQKPLMLALIQKLLDGKSMNSIITSENGDKPFHWAAENGYDAVIKLLLSTGKVDVNTKNEEGTALHHAARNRHEAVVRMLLAAGRVDADAKDRGWTPLHYAAERGHEAVVKLLLATGNVDLNATNERGTALHHAARNGHREVVKLLLATGKVDVDMMNHGWTALRDAAERGQEEVVKLLLDTGKANVNKADKFGDTPLYIAARIGLSGVVKLLLETGEIDINPRNNIDETPFLAAAACGHYEVVKLLLDTGKVDIDSKTRDGHTPLSRVATNGHSEIAKLLLATGKVDVNSKSKERNTPLLYAAANGYTDIVKLLLEAETVDINSKTLIGRTPFYYAAMNGHIETVKLMLQTDKVDVDSKDTNNETPLFTAAAIGNVEIVQLLLDTGKVDIDVKNSKGDTPFLKAVERAHTAVVELLLKTGKVDVNARGNACGPHTALSWSKRFDYYDEMVELLLKYGAEE